MWDHEVDTVTGVLAWDRAQDLREFAAGVAQVTWNENVMYADADGHIAYWHPGRYPRRSPLVDQRFPAPGTGGYDWRGLRSSATCRTSSTRSRAGWRTGTTSPAVGWSTGDAAVGLGGTFDHVRVLADQLRDAHGLRLEDLVTVDRRVGNSDARAKVYLPLLRGLRSAAGLSARQRAALDLLAGWDGQASDPSASVATGGTDGPAATLFDAYVRALRTTLFGGLPQGVFDRARKVALHLYDTTPLDTLAARVLAPATSGLRPARDWLGARTAVQVQLAALDTAMRSLESSYRTADMARWRRSHPRSELCSLTGGVVGPCVSMPYEDRGAYIQLVGLGR